MSFDTELKRISMPVGELKDVAIRVGFTGEKTECERCREVEAYVMTSGDSQQPCWKCETKDIDKHIYNEIAQRSMGQYKSLMNYAYLESDWKDARNTQAAATAQQVASNFFRSQWVGVYGKNQNDLQLIKNMMIRDIAQKKQFKIRSLSAFQMMQDIRSTYNGKSNSTELLRRYVVPDVLFIDDIELIASQIQAERSLDIQGWMINLAKTYQKDNKSMLLFASNKDAISSVFKGVMPEKTIKIEV